MAQKQADVSAAEVGSDAAQRALDSANAALKQYNDVIDAAKAAGAKRDEAQKAFDDAQAKLDAAQKAIADCEQQIADAKDELAKDKVLQADLEHVDHEASLAVGKTVFSDGWTTSNSFDKLDAAYARYKKAADAEAGLKSARDEADAKLSEANDAYANALATLGTANKNLDAAQAEYDKYHPKAEAKKDSGEQDVVKTAGDDAAKKAEPKHLAQAMPATGDASLAGEVFLIGGLTLVAAGVTLGSKKRRDQ